ncbi:hypothetical protein Pcinc_044008 [Petrolisthes cinctipes]|uniref:Uncharacterized protein n=1 Tax=Petrolisthes cinctipes TaxID=88211 RepID=A0AAE1BF26_PETCI|nr:hypothetical protein Pcinc_044008 [Petrolisthes cinctipes]
MLLGNDLAANQVVPNPEQLVENPMIAQEEEVIEPEMGKDEEKDDENEIYPACVVTWTKAKRMENKVGITHGRVSGITLAQRTRFSWDWRNKVL